MSYQQDIVDAANAYGVDPTLALAIANQESGFNPNATGSSGEMGLFQLMPATAQSLGVNNPYNPSENIDGAMNLLSQLNKKYGGNKAMIAAAFNAGEGAVDSGQIPTSTQDYVSKVLGGITNFTTQAVSLSGDVADVGIYLAIALVVATALMGD